tara:strand:- start:34821 stop:35588 length:768 start_codon:yes stop_codon:yes gene_type:complete
MLTPTQCLRFIKDNDVRVVYHLGAISSTTVSDTAKVAKNNILFSTQLLELCVANSIPFIYASSASTYGSIHGPHREWQPLKPINYYAISKTAFDLLAKQKIVDNPDARIVGLRYFNVYGHREHHKGDMASPVHKFIQQARKTGEIKIFAGSDGFKRDFIHISDVVAITKAASTFSSAQSGIYNVGTGIARTFEDVAQIIGTATGAKIVEIPFPDHLVGKYQRHTQSDNKKLSDRGGYTDDRLTLEEGIRETLREL